MIAIRHTPWSRATLVTGGTGTTGARVAERLWNRGGTVRLGHRGALPPFDWADPRTWARALDGAGAVYVAYQPDIAAPEAAGRVGAFAREAVARGARRLVLLSSLRARGARLAEDALTASGADWTILRASALMQTFTEGATLAPLLAGGAPALPVGGAREPFVDADDVAEVAAKALLQGGLEGRVLELTGPRALTVGEAVAEVADAMGRPGARPRQAPEPGPLLSRAAREAPAHGRGRTGAGRGDVAPPPLPEPLAALLGGPSLPATTVLADLLGRPARALRDVAADAWSLAEPPRSRRREREGT